MSKDGSSGGGINIGLQELLRINPGLMGNLQQGGGPSLTEQAMAAPPALPEDFYGSGTEITQPDMAYYEQFPLPGSEPPVQAPVAARQPAGNGQFNGIPIFDVGIGGEGGQYGGPSVPADQAPSQSMPILDMAGGSYRPAVMPAAGLFISESSPVMGDIRPDFRNFDIGMVGL